MALISITTIESGTPGESQQAAAQAQKLKGSLSRVAGLKVVADPEAKAEEGTKSGTVSMVAFAVEVVTSPHTIAAVGVVLFEWLKHNLGKSVQLVIEGQKIIVESGSHSHVQELVNVLEEKLAQRD